MSAPGSSAGSRAVLAAVAGVVLGVSALASVGALRDPATPLGQIVAVPAATFDETGGEAILQLEACSQGPDGLQVRGRVDPDAALAADGQLVLAVTGSGHGTAGQAVGVGFAYTAGLGDAIGSFLLTLPWANPDSRFAVVRRDSPASPVPQTGPAVRCPAPEEGP